MTSRQADKLVLAQAILRHKEKEDRTKREWPIPKGVGWVSKGSIFDCNRDSFTRSLRTYSDRLYVGWNPMKNEGLGCWEIWHRPSTKTAVLAYQDDSGLKIYKTEYRPNDFEHWVADLPYLDRAFIKRLREMDSWENKQLIAKHDDEHEAQLQKLEKDEDENIRHIVKENKRAFRDLLDYVQLGYEPTQFFTRKSK